MNAIEALKRDIELALPGVELKLRRPRKPNGTWWLDAMWLAPNGTEEQRARIRQGPPRVV